MMNKISVFLFIIILISCGQDTNQTHINKPTINNDVNDSIYVKDSTYKKGDTRRYGIYPDKPINSKNLKNIITLASKGLPIIFSKGFYKTNLRLIGLKDVQFTFNDAVIGGLLAVTNNDSITTERVYFKGNVTILDKLFIRKSEHITFDKVQVISDTTLNLYHKKNRGVSIYVGAKNIHFKGLTINDTGGENEEFYKLNASALQIHGWNDNPENIKIDYLEVNNSARTSVYLTGRNHKINKLIINNFGLGSNQNMFGLEDVAPKLEKEFSGFWMNKCHNCTIDSLIIKNPLNKGLFSLQLDYGLPHQPSFINTIHFDSFAKKMPVKDDNVTNILVKHEY